MKKTIIVLLFFSAFLLGCSKDQTTTDESNNETPGVETTEDATEKPTAEELLKSDQEKMDSAKRALGIE